MEETSSNAIEEYKQEINKYQTFWKSIEILTVIGKQDDIWTLLALRVFFNERYYQNEICDRLLQTPNICMFKEIKHSKYIDTLLECLKTKQLKIADVDVRVDDFRFDWSRSRKTSNPFELKINWPIIWLSGHGKSVKDLINEKQINKELNQLGYGTLFEESKDILDFNVGGAISTHISFIAPVYIRIDEGTLKGDHLTVKVKTHSSISLKDVRIVSPAYKGKVFPLNKDFMKENFNVYSSELSNIRADKDSVIVRAYYKNEPAELDIETIYRIPHEIAPHNPRAIVVTSFINEKSLRKWLGLEEHITMPVKGKPQKLKQYETVCINLLSCAGFFVLNFGEKWSIQGIDFVAFSPNSKDIIIASCVRTPTLKEKVENIKPGFNRLKKILKNYNILPIICTPVSSINDITSQNKKQCIDEGIGLITTKEMEKIYEMAMRGESTEIINYIKNLIEQYKTTLFD